MTRVADVYRKALKGYLESHPELGIRKVHVGTGYTDIDMGDMPPVDRVPTLKKTFTAMLENNVYSWT